MKKEESKTQKEELALQNRAAYLTPNIEVMEIEMEQTVFTGSGDLPGLPGQDW